MSEAPNLARLEQLLAKVQPNATLAEVVGRLTAYACCPSAPHPSTWLLTLTGDARFDDENDAREFLSEVLAAFRAIDAQLQLGESIGPNPDTDDPNGNMQVSQWCRGYFSAARTDPRWAKDADAMRRLLPIALLAGELAKVGEAHSPMHGEHMREKWTEAIPTIVANFYEAFADDRARHRTGA